jgi:hypothetical protein
MTTVFDLVTLICFAGLVFAFFNFTNRDTALLVRLLPAAIALALANQIGNTGAEIAAFILIVAAVGYTFFVIRK